MIFYLVFFAFMGRCQVCRPIHWTMFMYCMIHLVLFCLYGQMPSSSFNALNQAYPTLTFGMRRNFTGFGVGGLQQSTVKSTHTVKVVTITCHPLWKPWHQLLATTEHTQMYKSLAPNPAHCQFLTFLSSVRPYLWLHSLNCRHKRDSPPPFWHNLARSLFRWAEDWHSLCGTKSHPFLSGCTSIFKWYGANTNCEQGCTCSGPYYLCQVQNENW